MISTASKIHGNITACFTRVLNLPLTEFLKDSKPSSWCDCQLLHSAEQTADALRQLGVSLKYVEEVCPSSSTVSDDSLVRLLRRLKVLADALFTASWQELHIGPYTAVPDSARVLYGVSSLILAIASICDMILFYPKGMDGYEATLATAFKYADMGIIMYGIDDATHLKESGVCLGIYKRLLQVVGVLTELHAEEDKLASPIRPVDPNTPRQSPSLEAQFISSLPTAVNTERDLDVEDFVMNYLQPKNPVLIKGACNWWPATKKWSNPEYLRRCMGLRTVPIEVGSSYSAKNWSQRLMTVNDFFDKYYLNEAAAEVGYLAQHSLFVQIPTLLADVPTPEYSLCGSSSTPIKLCWIGPSGTVSPFHTDPYHNCFAQLVGLKYFRLYSPAFTPRMYPFDKVLRNTSRVAIDVLPDGLVAYSKRQTLEEGIDESTADIIDRKRFPHFPRRSECLECVVEAGDILFIPEGWWHFVKGLTRSASVSSWFVEK